MRLGFASDIEAWLDSEERVVAIWSIFKMVAGRSSIPLEVLLRTPRNHSWEDQFGNAISGGAEVVVAINPEAPVIRVYPTSSPTVFPIPVAWDMGMALGILADLMEFACLVAEVVDPEDEGKAHTYSIGTSRVVAALYSILPFVPVPNALRLCAAQRVFPRAELKFGEFITSPSSGMRNVALDTSTAKSYSYIPATVVLPVSINPVLVAYPITYRQLDDDAAHFVNYLPSLSKKCRWRTVVRAYGDGEDT